MQRFLSQQLMFGFVYPISLENTGHLPDRKVIAGL